MLKSRFWGSALTSSAPPRSDRSPQRSEPFQDGPATSLIHSLHRRAHTNACRFNEHSKEEAGTGRLFIKLSMQSREGASRSHVAALTIIFLLRVQDPDTDRILTPAKCVFFGHKSWRQCENLWPKGSPWPLFQLLNAARLTFITTGEATLHERLCNLIRCRETFEQVDFISV